MGTPLLCIRNKTFFSQIWRREVRRGEAGKKSLCIQTGGPAELMGSRRAAFLWGNHLHNVKVFGVGAESSPLVGTVSEVEGRERAGGREEERRRGRYQPEGRRRGAAGGRCALPIRLFARRHLPVSSAKQFTNNLPDNPGPIRASTSRLLSAAAELFRLHPANESCV